MSGVGPTELVIVLVLALIVFGPKRLPELGRSVGRGMREFKQAVSGGSRPLTRIRRAMPCPEHRPRRLRGDARTSAAPGAGTPSSSPTWRCAVPA